MVNLYEQRKNLVKKYLEIALKYNKLNYFVYGYPGFYIDYVDQSGKKSMDVQYTLEAIYDYYKEHGDSKINEKVFDLMLEASKSNFSVEILSNILNEIRYHMQKEKSGLAPFTMDSRLLLSEMKKNIENNHEHFSSKIIDDTQFPEYFDEFNEELDRRFPR